MNPETAERLESGLTQASIFYLTLKKANGAWVPSKTLAKRAGSVWPACVVRSLRRMGIPVQYNHRCKNHQSAYRMEVQP